MKTILWLLKLEIVACLSILTPFWALAQNSSLWETAQSANLQSPHHHPERLIKPEDLHTMKEKALEALRLKYKIKTEPETKILFELKMPKPQFHLQSGGGGVVDGGGGNINTQNNELLDHSLYGNLQTLPQFELTSLLDKFYGSRLDYLNQSLPGFRAWLFSGLQNPWYLHTQDFDPAKCKTAATGFCQLSDSVHVNAHQYRRATEEKKASMILRELIRKHSTAPSLEKTVDADQELLRKIVNPMTPPNEIFDFLIKAGFLYSESESELLRRSYVEQYEKALKPARQTLKDFLDSCKKAPLGFTRAFHKTVDQYMTYAQQCAAYLKPQIDGNSCEIESIAEALVLFNLSACARH